MALTLPPSPARRRIGLTPLIDVVFLLLVFFMLASTFIELRRLDVTVRRSDGATSAQTVGPVEVVLRASGAVEIAGAFVAPEAVGAAVAAALRASPGRPVVIRAESDVPVQRVVTVLDRLSAAGIEAVSIGRQ